MFGNFSLSPPIKAFSTCWSEIGWSKISKISKISKMGKMGKMFEPLGLSQSPNRWPHFFPSPSRWGWMWRMNNSARESNLMKNRKKKQNFIYFTLFSEWKAALIVSPHFFTNSRAKSNSSWGRNSKGSKEPVCLNLSCLMKMWHKYYKNKLTNLIGHGVYLPITFTPEKNFILQLLFVIS